MKLRDFSCAQSVWYLLVSGIVLSGGWLPGREAKAGPDVVTTAGLIESMVDMAKLGDYPSPAGKNVQYSSHDRRSTLPGGALWSANSDGFGREPVPGFDQVLKEPDAEGNGGEFVICDVHGPGAIVRTWTAGMDGTIRVILDGADEAVYDGPAKTFLASVYQDYAQKTGLDVEMLRRCFDHQDACYLPMPFAKGCRITWQGNLRRLHFYEVQVLHYEAGTQVASFSMDELKKAEGAIAKVAKIFSNVNDNYPYNPAGQVAELRETLRPDEKKQVLSLEGSERVEQLVLKIQAKDLVAALRQTVLYIRCDDYNLPQVASPVGDFFGAAPGINPYDSLPFSVEPDGTMTCRYVMPFQKKMIIELKNFGEQEVRVEGKVRHVACEWDPERSMYFFAHWRVKHDLITNDPGIADLPFVFARGKGCYVGTASLLMNPNPVPSSAGNWWGEGDEKVFVDDDEQPSIFGTGSEDYYNYSWSIGDIFVHPYCGQPRNDGPANRGFVTNYRWQINDLIPFNHSIYFSMELLTHQRTEGFSYARLGYYYAIPGTIDDHVFITREDVRKPVLPPTWTPDSSGGASNSVFFDIETIAEKGAKLVFESDGQWAGGKLAVWRPAETGKELVLTFPVAEEGSYIIRLVAAHTPVSGRLVAELDGQPLKLNGQDEAELATDFRILSRPVNGPRMALTKGDHRLVLKNTRPDSMLGLDFLWLQKR